MPSRRLALCYQISKMVRLSSHEWPRLRFPVRDAPTKPTPAYAPAGGTLVLAVTPAESAVAASVELSDETEAELGNDVSLRATRVSHTPPLLTTSSSSLFLRIPPSYSSSIVLYHESIPTAPLAIGAWLQVAARAGRLLQASA